MKGPPDAPRYSLIVATFNRRDELRTLLQSLTRQQLPLHLFETIIVDQNPPGFLDDIITEFKTELSLVCLTSGRKSLSASRNAGIRVAKGNFLLFPDDDCTYYEDTLKSLDQCLSKKPGLELVIGTVFDRQRGTHVFKKTPATSCPIRIGNFHAFVSSIALAVANKQVQFDEDFGIGEKYHSNEDADLILNCLKRGFSSWYLADMQFNHPPYNAQTMSREKLYNYGIGFGALVRKHLSAAILFLYFKVLVYQVLKIMQAALQGNGEEIKRRYAALSGRCKGFILYRRKSKI